MAATNLATTLPEIAVDNRLASLWYGFSFKADGWQVPDLWDETARDYKAADGWNRLHTNLPHHRTAPLRVLQVKAKRDTVSRVVKGWSIYDLESPIVAEGGVAAAMRSRAEWQDVPTLSVPSRL